MKIDFVKLSENRKSYKPKDVKEYITIYAIKPTTEDWLVDVEEYEHLYCTWEEAIDRAKSRYDIVRVEKRYRRIQVAPEE